MKARYIVDRLLEADELPSPPDPGEKLFRSLGASHPEIKRYLAKGDYTKNILTKEFVSVVQQAAPSVRLFPEGRAGEFKLAVRVMPVPKNFTLELAHKTATNFGIDVDEYYFYMNELGYDSLDDPEEEAGDDMDAFHARSQHLRDKGDQERAITDFLYRAVVKGEAEGDEWKAEDTRRRTDIRLAVSTELSTDMLELEWENFHVDRTTPEKVASRAKQLVSLAGHVETFVTKITSG